MNYPIKFEKCPVCGSDKRIVNEETKIEIEKGNLPDGAKIPALISQSKLVDMSTQMLLVRKSFPVLMGFIDICADCGTLYCVEVQKATGVIDPQVRSQPPGMYRPNGDGGQAPPFFGKG